MITCKSDRLLEFLWFVGYCIEFPSQLAVRIGGHPEWNRHVMYRAIELGYVVVNRCTYRGRILRSLRLTSKGIDYIAIADYVLILDTPSTVPVSVVRRRLCGTMR